MTQVEIGQTTTTSYDDEPESTEYGVLEESRVPLKKVSEPTIIEAGISFQRCGGGRRVLRKKVGA